MDRTNEPFTSLREQKTCYTKKQQMISDRFTSFQTVPALHLIKSRAIRTIFLPRTRHLVISGSEDGGRTQLTKTKVVASGELEVAKAPGAMGKTPLVVPGPTTDSPTVIVCLSNPLPLFVFIYAPFPYIADHGCTSPGENRSICRWCIAM